MGDPDFGTKAGTQRAGRSVLPDLSIQAGIELQKCSIATHTILEIVDASPDYPGIDRFIRDLER